MQTVRPRRNLTQQQVTILQILYKFDFATALQITTSQQANHLRVIQGRLKKLVDQKYIGMNYDRTYKIAGKPATYFLLTDGIKYLRNQTYTNSKALRRHSYDKHAPQSRINHCLHVFDLYIKLKQSHPSIFHFYSNSELVDRAYLPRVKPDAYLKRIVPSSTLPNEYLLEYIDQSQNYGYLYKIIRKYIKYAESELWEQTINQPFPVILLVCETELLKRRVQRLISRETDNTYAELHFSIATEENIAKNDVWWYFIPI